MKETLRSIPVIKLLVTSLIILSIFVSILFFSSISSVDITSFKPEDIDTNESEDTTLAIESQNVNIKQFTYSAWIPSWGATSGLSSLITNIDLFYSISPVWYEINSDGSLKKTYGKYRDEIIKTIKDNEIELIPAIAMFDHELFTKVLQDQDNLDRHVDSILNTVIENDYDGIDLDYESTKLSDKDKYFEFLTKLSKKLKEADKKLIVTVIAKWGENISYPSLIETRQVQDWFEILKYADKIRIMAYDYTFARSAFPGPIGPLNWIEEILKYAVTKGDPERFVLGIHLYSYEWESDTELPFLPSYSMNSTSEKSAKAYTYNQVLQILSENEGRSYEFEGEDVFEYRNGDKYRSMVYIDEQGINDRIQLTQEYSLSGIVFWRIGSEGSLLSNLGI